MMIRNKPYSTKSFGRQIEFRGLGLSLSLSLSPSVCALAFSSHPKRRCGIRSRRDSLIVCVQRGPSGDGRATNGRERKRERERVRETGGRAKESRDLSDGSGEAQRKGWKGGLRTRDSRRNSFARRRSVSSVAIQCRYTCNYPVNSA